MMNKKIIVHLLVYTISSSLFAMHAEVSKTRKDNYHRKKPLTETVVGRCASDKKHRSKKLKRQADNRSITNRQLIGALMLVSISGAYASHATDQISSRHRTNNQCPPIDKRIDDRNAFDRSFWDVCHDKENDMRQCCRVIDNRNIACCRFNLDNGIKSCGTIELVGSIDAEVNRKDLLDDMRNIPVLKDDETWLIKPQFTYSKCRDFLESDQAPGSYLDAENLAKFFPNLSNFLKELVRAYQIDFPRVVFTHDYTSSYEKKNNTLLIRSSDLDSDRKGMAVLAHELGHARQEKAGTLAHALEQVKGMPPVLRSRTDVEPLLRNNLENHADILAALATEQPSSLALLFMPLNSVVLNKDGQEKSEELKDYLDMLYLYSLGKDEDLRKECWLSTHPPSIGSRLSLMLELKKKYPALIEKLREDICTRCLGSL